MGKVHFISKQFTLFEPPNKILTEFTPPNKLSQCNLLRNLIFLIYFYFHNLNLVLKFGMMITSDKTNSRGIDHHRSGLAAAEAAPSSRQRRFGADRGRRHVNALDWSGRRENKRRWHNVAMMSEQDGSGDEPAKPAILNLKVTWGLGLSCFTRRWLPFAALWNRQTAAIM